MIEYHDTAMYDIEPLMVVDAELDGTVRTLLDWRVGAHTGLDGALQATVLARYVGGQSLQELWSRCCLQRWEHRWRVSGWAGMRLKEDVCILCKWGRVHENNRVLMSDVSLSSRSVFFEACCRGVFSCLLIGLQADFSWRFTFYVG